jgi:segregation and condensation protein A
MERMTMAPDPYAIKLDEVFEGPMDLLVHLIKKNEVDIYDIPIAVITKQFLTYLEWMKSLNIDFAGDFLVMAATLTQVKSRMLLPVHPSEEEDEDPRLAITRPLEEYLQMKSVAEQLTQRHILGEDTFARGAHLRAADLSDDETDMIKIGLFELIDAFQKILDNLSEDALLEYTADRKSVKERIAELVDLLEKKGSLAFRELFGEAPVKSEIVISFLALLEMVKLCLVRIVQHTQSGVIRIFYQ